MPIQIENIFPEKNKLKNEKPYTNKENKMLIINLPENREQLKNLYENFFNKLNKKNEIQGISLLQEENKLNTKSKSTEKYQKVEFPVKKGYVNDLPQPDKIKTIGVDPFPDVNATKTNKTVSPKVLLANENKQVDDAEHEPFPTTRVERPYEKQDDAYNQQVIAQQNEVKGKIQNQLKGFSFLQKRTDDEIQDDTDIERKKLEEINKKAELKIKNIGKLLSKMKQSINLKKKETKENLNNCKGKCQDTCKRFASLSLKNESFSLCQIKCELACTNNALNNLMK